MSAITFTRRDSRQSSVRYCSLLVCYTSQGYDKHASAWFFPEENTAENSSAGDNMSMPVGVGTGAKVGIGVGARVGAGDGKSVGTGTGTGVGRGDGCSKGREMEA